MLDFLLHLWAGPPASLPLQCPAPPPGEPIDPGGLYDPSTVSAAYGFVGVVSLGAVIVLVVACYMLARSSLGPGFVKRWWYFLIATVVAGALIPIAILHFWPTQALAGSCDTNPGAFPATLPWSEVLDRGVAGGVWALLAFVIISVIATRTIGWVPQGGGFFHNRGCPLPRWR